MTANDLVYQLLDDALLELREAGTAEARDPRVFPLAHLFHPYPRWLRELADGEVEADEVLDRLRDRAATIKIGGWVDARINAHQAGADRLAPSAAV